MERLLTELNLGHLVPRFTAENITVQVIAHLDDQKFMDLGVNRLGDRVMLRTRARSISSNSAEERMLAAQEERRTIFQLPRNQVSTISISDRVKHHSKVKGRPARVKKVARTMYCLASKTQINKPSSAEERLRLASAGLGEKLVVVEATDDASAYKEAIYQVFPKLAEGGGFEFLKSNGNCKTLQLIKPPALGYTANLVQQVYQSGKIYIRPVQKDLDLDDFKNEMEMEEACLTCGGKIPIRLLRSHRETCHDDHEDLDDDDDDDDLNHDINWDAAFSGTLAPTPNSSFPYLLYPNSILSNMGNPNRSDVSSTVTSSSSLSDAVNSASTLNQSEVHSSIDAAESPSFVFNESISPAAVDDAHPVALSSELETESTMYTILKSWQSHTLDTTQRPQRLRTQRGKEWAYFLRAMRNGFDPKQDFVVEFINEDGVDNGGLKREFLTLAMKHLVSHTSVFIECENSKIFSSNGIYLSENLYKLCGQFVAMSLLHGGPGLHCLNESVYLKLAGKAFNVKVNDVDDYNRRLIEMLSGSESEENLLTQLALTEVEELLTDVGVNARSINIAKLPKLIGVICRYLVIDKCHAAIEQFLTGLSSLNLSDVVGENHILLQPLFCEPVAHLNGDSFRGLFSKIAYSEKGSNRCVFEEQTILSWEEYIDRCAASTASTVALDSTTFKDVNKSIWEQNQALDFDTSLELELKLTGCVDSVQCSESNSVIPSLQDILFFSTGSDCIPSLGFDCKISIQFYDQEVQMGVRLPFVSTCSLTLWLPRGVEDGVEFEKLMDRAIQESHGFGKA